MTVVDTPRPARGHRKSAPPVDTGGFRGDIQGLRAIAVLLVLGFHAGVPWLSGGFVGVDVFFVISGFLITGLIVREIETTGRLDLRRFWARRVRRLLPATAVTLGAVAVITVTVLPFTRWPAIAGDIAASAAYVENWRLASTAVDYLAAEAAPSPVQHFWSLAVEEQFYIVWPLMIVGLIVLAVRVGWSLRRALLVGITTLAVTSLAWSAYLTDAEPGRAYFVSTTRVWELAIGAALALVAPHLVRLTPAAAVVLGWAGLAAIAYAAAMYDAATAFPGLAALVPTLGAAAVLAAGIRPTTGGAERVLRVPVMQDIGTLSYSLYLWHWPVLVAAAALWGSGDGSLPLSIALMAVGFSAVPAWLTYRIVEAPIHHGRYFRKLPRAAVLGIGCTAVGVAAAVVVSASVPEAQPAPVAAPMPTASAGATTPPNPTPGAGIFDTVDDPAEVFVDEASVPLDPIAAVDDNAVIYADGCHQDQRDTELLSCTYGDPESDTVVALVGDSHAGQWAPTLIAIAEQRGWRLETYTKSACGFFTVDVTTADGEPYTSCTGWNTKLREHLTGPDGPDLVVASSSVAQRVLVDGEEVEDNDANIDLLADGMREAWEEVEAGGVDVVVIRDTPRRGFETPECVAQNPTNLSECVTGLGSRYLSETDLKAAEDAEGVGWIEMTPYICPGDECPGVIGNVIVWRDRHHLTATYARSLAPFLDRALEAADVGQFRSAFEG